MQGTVVRTLLWGIRPEIVGLTLFVLCIGTYHQCLQPRFGAAQVAVARRLTQIRERRAAAEKNAVSAPVTAPLGRLDLRYSPPTSLVDNRTPIPAPDDLKQRLAIQDPDVTSDHKVRQDRRAKFSKTFLDEPSRPLRAKQNRPQDRQLAAVIEEPTTARTEADRDEQADGQALWQEPSLDVADVRWPAVPTQSPRPAATAKTTPEPGERQA